MDPGVASSEFIVLTIDAGEPRPGGRRRRHPATRRNSIWTGSLPALLDTEYARLTLAGRPRRRADAKLSRAGRDIALSLHSGVRACWA